MWYDTTALITINSDKNLIATRVTGRDYSRKELVSNGDIKFTVSGQITSGKPDIYPAEEMQKFYKIMQYKGIVKINNMVLDQLGITHIVIENFNVSPRQGYKALQQYTFSAIGLQPENEIEISEDTISIIPQKNVSANDDDGSEWMKMLNNQRRTEVYGLRCIQTRNGPRRRSVGRYLIIYGFRFNSTPNSTPGSGSAGRVHPHAQILSA